MKYRVSFTRSARLQISAIHEYFREEAPAFADRWLAGLYEAAGTLDELPHRCVIAPENELFTHEVRHLLYSAYRIVYMIRGRSVYILAVRHSSQQAP